MEYIFLSRTDTPTTDDWNVYVFKMHRQTQASMHASANCSLPKIGKRSAL